MKRATTTFSCHQPLHPGMGREFLSRLSALVLIFCSFNYVFAHEIHVVDIVKYNYQPSVLTIHAGDTVCWINREVRQYHNVWFEESGEPEPGYFFPGESYHKTFREPGIYPYRCGPHPKMTGVIHVNERTINKQQVHSHLNSNIDNICEPFITIEKEQ
jgi:plastocyanin